MKIDYNTENRCELPNAEFKPKNTAQAFLREKSRVTCCSTSSTSVE